MASSGKLASLKFHRAEIPEAGMKALTVIKDFNEGENLLFCLLARGEHAPIHQLPLQSGEKALHNGVIITIPFVAHAAQHAQRPQTALVRMTGELTATIRMMNSTAWW